MAHESVLPFSEALKKARLKKGISQRTLSKKIGMPQSHISKIERGQVDLQLSSFIEFARYLDLEPILVPKQMVPLMQALQKGKSEKEQVPMYQLEDEEDD